MHSQTKPTSILLVLALLLVLCGAGSQKLLCAQTTISQVTNAALRDTNGQKIIQTPTTSTGEFYLAESYVSNGSATLIRYQDVWNNGPWRVAQILATQGLIDIAAASCGKFRIAVSDIVIGNGTYGPTWYRTGQWSGVNPTWAEPQKVQVAALGRDPQAFFGTSSQSSQIHREIPVMFEELSGTSYFVKHNLITRKGPVLYDCRIKDVRDETRDTVTQVRE